MTVLVSLFAFLVAIGVIVSFHEFGHFWTARRLGVKVLRYSIGFGKPLWRRLGKDGTEYVVAAIPLGGYVKMLDEHEGPVEPSMLQHAFNRQSLGVRTAVVAAGPIANFILAFLLYYLMFMVGVSGFRPVVSEVAPGSVAARAGVVPGDRFVKISGEPVQSWQQVLFALLDTGFKQPLFGVEVAASDGAARHLMFDLAGLNLLGDDDLIGQLGITPQRPRVQAVIDKVFSGTSAERAQLRAGDRIVLFDGEEVGDWSELVKLIRARPGEHVTASVVRDGARFEVEIELGVSEADGAGYLGASARVSRQDYLLFVRYGPFDSLRLAADKTWQVTTLTLEVMKRLILGDAALEHLSGPVGIAEYAGLSLLQGLGSFLGLLALLSISIGILNLLPVPVLDGGHLLYYLIEFIKGKPLSAQAQLVGQWAGVFVLSCLMFLALYNDLNRLFG